MLAGRCTFRIGGSVPLLCSPKNADEIAGLCRAAGELGIPLLVLGKGSNILFSDRGCDGAILHLGQSFSDISLEGETAVICQSGASVTQLCRFACEHGLSGLEFAYGIPGSVGGAVYMNAGAYGGEIKDVIVSASHITPDGAYGSFLRDELSLSYRRSIYNSMDYVIIGAKFALTKDDPALISARMEGFMNRRREKQPLEYPSAGSTFKRPEGAYASALVDRCGLKGLRVGGAAVSGKHAGFLINYDNATAEDMRNLIARVQDEVFRQTGFRLECEIKQIGF